MFATRSSNGVRIGSVLVAACAAALPGCSDGSDAPATGAAASGGSGNAAGAAGASTGSGGTTSDAAVDATGGASGATGGSPYACGWIPGDPGNLTATGPNVGDVVENIPLLDQCGDELPLWDVAGEYHLLFMTTVW